MVAMRLLPLAALLSSALALPRGQPTYNVFDEDDTCEADEPEPTITSEAAAIPTVTLSSTALPPTAVSSSSIAATSVPALTLVATSSAAAVSSANIVTSAAASSAQISSAAVSSPASSSTATSSTGTSTSGGNTTYAGVNIAGFDFGCSTDGTCVVSNADGPLTTLNNGADGIGQMKHFFTDDGMNIFRLPVGWQYLTNSGSDYSTLDTTNFGNYDQLVQGCLATGAKCIIDIHNYARYNGKIVGQDSGAPTADQFAALWSNIATKYADSDSVVFGIMNEPHDVDITTWGNTVQTVVTAIRKATGSTSHMILLPGTQYTSATAFVSDGSFDALSKVTNSDATTTNLIFDVHQYLDSDNSGTHTTCVTDNTAGLATLQAKLESAGRQAILSETGGGPRDSSCLTDVCAEIAFLNKNSGQFIGYVGWSAGSFATSYELSLTPTNNGGTWTDVPLMSQCFARK